MLELNSLCKNIFLIFFWQIPCVFPVWKNELPNSRFSLCRGYPDQWSRTHFMFLFLPSIWQCKHDDGIFTVTDSNTESECLRPNKTTCRKQKRNVPLKNKIFFLNVYYLSPLIVILFRSRSNRFFAHQVESVTINTKEVECFTVNLSIKMTLNHNSLNNLTNLWNPFWHFLSSRR